MSRPSAWRSSASLKQLGVAVLAIALLGVGARTLWQGKVQQLQSTRATLKDQRDESAAALQAQLDILKQVADSDSANRLKPYAPAVWLSQLRDSMINREGVSDFRARVLDRELLRLEVLPTESIISVPLELEFRASTARQSLLLVQAMESVLEHTALPSVAHISLERTSRQSVSRGFYFRARLSMFALEKRVQP